MNIISLGAGVQSTTLLLMAAHGELEPKYEPKTMFGHFIDSVVKRAIHDAKNKEDDE